MCVKLTLVLLLTASLHLSANNIAQQMKISLTMNDASMTDVFSALEKMTRYTFLYKNDLLGKCGKVNLRASDETLETVLERILPPCGLSWQIDDNVVIIKRQDVPVRQQEEIHISGKISDKNGKPLPGVTILLKNIFMGVTSDGDGKYEIVIPAVKEPVLVYTFLGMKPVEVKYVGKNVIDVTMYEDIKEMDEVVVTGYQQIKKSNMVGSANSVKREELVFDGTNTIEQMLQGKLPGTLVMNTSGLVGVRQKVRVRGTSTLLGNQEPVWVVDGIIQEDPLPFKTRELDAFGNISQDNFDMVKDFIGNAISWLNPNDIQDITVLKDASATVLYGVKAANGVIVITTKKGQRGRVSVSYSGGVAVTPKLNYRKMNLMNSKERIDVSREIYQRGLIADNGRSLETVGYEGALNRYLNKEITYDQFDQEVKRMEAMNTDWFDILFRNPVSTNHSLSISGGTETMSYYGSINAIINNGTARGNDSKTYSGSLRINSQLNKKLTVGLGLNVSQSETNGFYTVDPYGYATSTSRAIPCFDENGENYFYKKTTNGYKYNILNEISQTGNTNTSKTFGLNADVRWTIVEGLRFETLFGLNASSTFGESYAGEESYYISQIRGYEFGSYRPSDQLYQMSPLPHGGEYNSTENRNLNYTWRNSLSYDQIFGDRHRVSLVLGQEARSNKYDGLSQTAYGYFHNRGKSFTNPPLIIHTNTMGETDRNDLYDKCQQILTDRKSNYLAFYFTGSYAFDERYIVTGSIRSDASNRFGQDTRNRFLPVWSIGGRWNVHNEPWMKSQRVVSDLNFRASYGWQGNVAENYGPDLIAYIGTGNDLIDYQSGDFMLKIKSLPYGDLRWEKTKTINLGMDVGFFSNRLNASVEYYRKKTEDMIVEKQVPYAYGVASMPINGGDMLNRGVEIQLGATLIRTNTFSWALSVNTSKNFNRVESKMNENKNWRTAVSGSLNKAGYPVSSVWAFEFLGLDQTDGRPLFALPSLAENPEAALDATAYMKYM